MRRPRRNRATDRGRTSRSKLSLALVVALSVASCSYQMKGLTTVGVSTPTAKECGKCHVAIHDEWSASAHAQAWTSPDFLRATAQHSVTACLSCHAAETVYTDGATPQTRSYLRDEGVTCLTCHLHENSQHGPFPGAGSPHAMSGPDPLFRQAALCGVCHRGTYEEWRNASVDGEDAPTCQTCHMPRTTRKMTSASNIFAKPFVAMHDAHEMRRHTFNVEVVENYPSAIGFEARRDADAIVLVVRNNLPHLVPTGDYGYRHARLTIELADESGATIATATRDFLRDLDSALPARGRIEWRLTENLDVAGRAKKIHARIDSLNADESVRFEIAETTLSVASTGSRGPGRRTSR